MKLKLRSLLLALSVFLLITIVIDLIRISSYDVKPRRPAKDIRLEQDAVYRDLLAGKEIDWDRLEGTLEYIDGQYDCADFRYVNLIRILYEFGDKIPDAAHSRIKETLFNFRYWWDEPGENSMCYWSENHQILFASAEYLTGQLYSDVTFKASQLTGRQHMEKARVRILDWLEMRWKYGFTEFYSGVYYKEDVGAMINLIDFAEDPEIEQKTKIIMDLLLFDVAHESIDNYFVSVSGRAYTGNRKGGPGSDFGGLTSYYWGNGDPVRSGMMHGMMVSKKYTPPPVLREIARDTSNVVIKQRNGLDIVDIKPEGYFGTDNRSMMMQWGMESFTNPEIISNSLSLIREARMFSNDFIKDFRNIDFTLFRWLHLEPTLIRIINPQSNGVAIQKGNTYTYRTKNYTLYSVQKYHPGSYGDQHHVAGMNVGSAFSIFHTHPAIEKDEERQSPNYWVGYGHLPYVAQHKNVSLAIYNLPDSKGVMEADLLHYTHAYFPTEMFDSVFIEDNHAFGKKGDTYAALIGLHPLRLREGSTDDLIQEGKQTFWIIEAGNTREDGSFKSFVDRILGNEITLTVDLQLSYLSGEGDYILTSGGNFYLNGEKVDVEYDRFDSPYCRAPYKPDSVKIEFNRKSLFLDFHKMIREFKEQ